MPASTRSYRSPLREAQAGQTRDLILDTFAELVGAGRADASSVREIAAEAGVSERTVYRYFPDRQSLLEGLSEWLTERLGTAPFESEAENADDFAQVVPLVFDRFDSEAELARATYMLSPDPARPLDNSRRRTELVGSLIEQSFPELSEADQLRVQALTRLLISASTWLRMREEFGLSGLESGGIVSWALGVLYAEIRDKGGVEIRSSI